jgi:TRAP-type mannitol/chloroaromatic compound transport system substrate-binding protein
MEENAAADATYRSIHDQWRQFRDNSFRWFGTSEQAYAAFAFGAGSQGQA